MVTLHNIFFLVVCKKNTKSTNGSAATQSLYSIQTIFFHLVLMVGKLMFYDFQQKKRIVREFSSVFIYFVANVHSLAWLIPNQTIPNHQPKNYYSRISITVRQAGIIRTHTYAIHTQNNNKKFQSNFIKSNLLTD